MALVHLRGSLAVEWHAVALLTCLPLGSLIILYECGIAQLGSQSISRLSLLAVASGRVVTFTAVPNIFSIAVLLTSSLEFWGVSWPTEFGSSVNLKVPEPSICAAFSSFFSSSINSARNSSLMVSQGDDSDVIVRPPPRLKKTAKINATYDKNSTVIQVNSLMRNRNQHSISNHKINHCQ